MGLIQSSVLKVDSSCAYIRVIILIAYADLFWSCPFTIVELFGDDEFFSKIIELISV